MSQVVILDVLPRTQAIAIASQTVFMTNWTADQASDVLVYQTPSGNAPNDATQLLNTSQYSITFIGGSQEVQVTLVSGASAGDIITIVRNTPADRMNLYSNTNFTPSMLNNDFGILTLVDQQAQLVNRVIAPHYNYSAQINNDNSFPNRDTILPLLGANQTWVMNSTHTGIITYLLPQNGIAPAEATYILQTPNASLPNSQALNAIGANALLAWNQGTHQVTATGISGTANEITVTNGDGNGTIGLSIPNNPVMPGTGAMGIPGGTTLQRVVTSGTPLRYNSTIDSLEFYSNGVWHLLSDDSDGIINPGLINQLAYYAAAGNTLSGLTTGNYGVLVSSSIGAPSWLANGTTGQILTATTSGTPSWQNPATSGTVTSFSSGNLSPLFTTSVATATTTPALSFSLTNAAANTYFGNATGGSAAPSYTAAGALTKTDDTNVTLTLGGSPTVALLAAASLTLGWSGTLAVSRGGTGVSSVTTTPTATAFAGWDANKNLSANSFLSGYTTTATAAGTTTLTVASTYQQFFTGITTQTVVMPVTSTLALGQAFRIVNNSSGALTINSSGGNNILTAGASTVTDIICILTSGTTAASWYFSLVDQNEGGGVTSVATGTGLTGGPITTTGTISLASIADHTLLANTSGGSAAPISTTLTALIDNAIGSTQGNILYRNASAWVVLAPGTSGQVLSTGGPAANPSWISNVTANPCVFSAHLSTNQNNVTGDGTAYDIPFDTADINVGSNFNAGTGVFTAPSTGNYQLSCIIGCNPSLVDTSVIWGLTQNSTFIYLGDTTGTLIPGAGGNAVFSGIIILPLTAGDTVKVTFTVSGSTKSVNVYGSNSAITVSRFMGQQIV